MINGNSLTIEEPSTIQEATTLVETTIEDILLDLKNIVIENKKTNPRLAYFAVLYLYVTKRIQIETSKPKKPYKDYEDKEKKFSPFEDNDRMKRLDVIFAKRYIDAYNGWKDGKKISESWKIAFDFAVSNSSSMIMQHLLLGMNAHINLDLGIATVEATTVENDGSKPKCEYKNFNSIVTDFSAINNILSDLTETVEECLATNSFFFGLIRKYGKGKEAILANFSMQYARSAAWNFASEYRYQNNSDTICIRDKEINGLADKMIHPKSILVRIFIILGSFTESIMGKNFTDHMIKSLDATFPKELGVTFDEIEKKIEIAKNN